MENEVKEEVKVETKKKGNGLFTVFACVMTGVIVFLASNLGDKASKVVDPETNSGNTTTSNVESNVASNVTSNDVSNTVSNVTSNVVSNTNNNAQVITDKYTLEFYKFKDEASMNKYYNAQVEYQKQAATGGKVDIITNNANVFEAILYEVPNENLPLLDKEIYCYVLFIRNGKDYFAVYSGDINPNTSNIKSLGNILKTKFASNSNVEAVFNEFVKEDKLITTEAVFDKESLAKDGCYKAVSASKKEKLTDEEALKVGYDLYAQAKDTFVTPLNIQSCTTVKTDGSITTYDCTDLYNAAKKVFVKNHSTFKNYTLKDGKYLYEAGATGSTGTESASLKVKSNTDTKITYTVTIVKTAFDGSKSTSTEEFVIVKEDGTWKVSVY